jgi:hypothetical protein
MLLHYLTVHMIDDMSVKKPVRIKKSEWKSVERPYCFHSRVALKSNLLLTVMNSTYCKNEGLAQW